MEILAIDDDPLLLHTIQMVLEDSFGEIQTQDHPDHLDSVLSQFDIKVIILDLNFAIGDSDGSEGLAWISRIKNQYPHISIIILTAHGLLDIAVKAMKQGASDFLEKPFSNEKLVATVQSALNLAHSQLKLAELNSSRDTLIRHINQTDGMVVGKSQVMKDLLDTVAKVANTEASVLITGEHGTGKEVLARYIHHKSIRASQPFVLADLSAISDGLFESILFGHKKGSFTDANEDKAGLIETANLGSLLLDEIGDLDLTLQSKLLTVLESREVRRVGEQHTRALDIRVMSTSHLSIDELNNLDIFRRDLLYRINTVHINIPPLRHRRDDIQPLMQFFLDHFNRKYRRDLRLAKKVIADMKTYDWPGNVRELKNTIERMVIMDDHENFEGHNLSKPKDDNLYALEKSKIEEVIKRHAGNISRAASELGIGRNTLYRKMKKYDL